MVKVEDEFSRFCFASKLTAKVQIAMLLYSLGPNDPGVLAMNLHSVAMLTPVSAPWRVGHSVFQLFSQCDGQVQVL